MISLRHLIKTNYLVNKLGRNFWFILARKWDQLEALFKNNNLNVAGHHLMEVYIIDDVSLKAGMKFDRYGRILVVYMEMEPNVKW